MQQLSNLMTKVKLRVKPVLLERYLKIRNKMLLTSVLSGAWLFICFNIIHLVDRESFIHTLLGTSVLMCIPTSLFTLLISWIFQTEYKKLLKKEWTGSVIEGDKSIKDVEQQLTIDEVKSLFNVDLPQKLLFYIDYAISKKGFLTHDDLHEMLQHNEKDATVENHYRDFIERMMDYTPQQQENLQNLLALYKGEKHYKTFNSRKVL